MKDEKFCVACTNATIEGKIQEIDKNLYRVYGEYNHRVFDVYVKRTKDNILLFYYLGASKPNNRNFEHDISSIVRDIFEKKVIAKGKKICSHKHLACNGLNSFICYDCGKSFDMDNASDDDKMFCLSHVYQICRRRREQVPETFISQFRSSKFDKLISLVKTIDLHNSTVTTPILNIIAGEPE